MNEQLLNRIEGMAVDLGDGIDAGVPLLDFAGFELESCDHSVCVSLIFNCPRPLRTDYIYTVKVDSFGLREYGPDLVIVGTGLGLDALGDPDFETTDLIPAMVADFVRAIRFDAPMLFDDILVF